VLPSDEADRVELEINLCDFELVLKSGQRRNLRVEYHRGHWKNPMTDAEVEEKFRALAHRQLPAARTDDLLRQLWGSRACRRQARCSPRRWFDRRDGGLIAKKKGPPRRGQVVGGNRPEGPCAVEPFAAGR